MDNGEHFYKDLMDNLYDGVYFVDSERRILYWNQGAKRISGYSGDEIVGMRCPDGLLCHVDDSGENLCHSGCPLLATLHDGQERENDVYLHHKHGHRVPVQVRTSAVRGTDGGIVGAVEVFSDNSWKQSMQQRIQDLQQMALLDHLTQLGNRRFVEMQLLSRIDEFNRYGWLSGVLLFDIDHFKHVNDTYGHDSGDRALQIVAQTLSTNARPFDAVGRWGGEEFVAVLANVTEEQLKSIAERFRILVAASSVSIGGDEIRITVSVGGTLIASSDTVDTIFKRIDRMLYQSKQNGRNRVTLETDVIKHP